MSHSFVSKERVCSHGRDLVPNAVVTDLRETYARNSSEVQIAQKELGVRLQGGENIACTRHIFGALYRHPSSGETLSRVVISRESGIHRGLSSQMVWTVSHVLFCQYEGG